MTINFFMSSSYLQCSASRQDSKDLGVLIPELGVAILLDESSGVEDSASAQILSAEGKSAHSYSSNSRAIDIGFGQTQCGNERKKEMTIRRWNRVSVQSGASPIATVLLLTAGTLVGCANAKVGDLGARDAASTDNPDTASVGTADLTGATQNDAGQVVYSPCNPFDNTGCASGQKCGAFQQSNKTLALGCGDKGSKVENDACSQVVVSGTQTGDDCGDGLACFNVGGKTICRRVCPTAGTANACPSNEACSMVISGLSGLAFCQVGTGCLPLEQTGCPSGQACYYSTKGAVCATAGTIAAGQSCHNSNDCAKGSTCLVVNGAGTCSSFCSVASGGTPACSGANTGGTTCVALTGANDEANLGSCRTP